MKLSGSPVFPIINSRKCIKDRKVRRHWKTQVLWKKPSLWNWEVPGEPDQIENKQLLHMLFLEQMWGEPPSTGNLNGTGATSENVLWNACPQCDSGRSHPRRKTLGFPSPSASGPEFSFCSACPKGHLQAEFIFRGARLVTLSLRSHLYVWFTHLLRCLRFLNHNILNVQLNPWARLVTADRTSQKRWRERCGWSWKFSCLAQCCSGALRNHILHSILQRQKSQVRDLIRERGMGL